MSRYLIGWVAASLIALAHWITYLEVAASMGTFTGAERYSGFFSVTSNFLVAECMLSFVVLALYSGMQYSRGKTT